MVETRFEKVSGSMSRSSLNLYKFVLNFNRWYLVIERLKLLLLHQKQKTTNKKKYIQGLCVCRQASDTDECLVINFKYFGVCCGNELVLHTKACIAKMLKEYCYRAPPIFNNCKMRCATLPGNYHTILASHGHDSATIVF